MDNGLSVHFWGAVDIYPRTKLSPCEAQRLFQLLLIHRAYISASLLCRIGVRGDSTGPRCSLDDAHIIHMFWECVTLGGFWRNVLDIICSVHSIQLLAVPKTCFLGLLDSLDVDTPVFLSISRMIFQTRKLIAFHWLCPIPPTSPEYVARLNNIIRLEKGVYVNRKATHTF